MAATVLAGFLAILAAQLPAVPSAGATNLLMQVKKRPLAPGFILPDITGQPYRLEGMRGRVVVVNFWTTGCPSCRAEMPALDRMWRNLRDKGVVVWAIHIGGNIEQVRRFVRESGVTFPVLWDSGKLVADEWGVRFIPTTMIIGPDGRLEYIAFGGRVWTNPEIQNAILKLLEKP